jgi:hypothetical protein
LIEPNVTIRGLRMEICGDKEADYRIAIIFLEAQRAYPDFFG